MAICAHGRPNRWGALRTKALPLKCPTILFSKFTLSKPKHLRSSSAAMVTCLNNHTVQFTFKPQACECQDGSICATAFNVMLGVEL